jgi:hypothetical protein
MMLLVSVVLALLVIAPATAYISSPGRLRMTVSRRTDVALFGASNGIETESIKAAALARVASLMLLSGIGTFNIIAPISPAVATEALSATEMLKSDIGPKLSILKDIDFAFKLFPSFVEKQEYVELRQALRESPTMDLRKTCRKLKPFLPSEIQVKYEDAYKTMIESFEDMDVVS